MKRLAIFAVPMVSLVALLSLGAPSAAAASMAAHGAHTSRPVSHHHHIVFFPTLQHWRKMHHNRHPYAGSPNDLMYNGGPVEENPVVYVIFWGPGWSNGSGGVTADGQVVENYFNSMGGTSFENILTQYYDNNANVSNSNSVSGVWVDTSTPPTDQSCGGPTVEDSDIQNEVSNAISANGWPTDGSNATYFVYTPNGDYVNGGGSCSDTAGGFCAYHNWDSSINVAYAAMAYPINSGCNVPQSPNGNLAGDSLANVTSHEQFEAITDPQAGNGWLDSSGQEIGDKCAWDFSAGLTNLNGQSFELQTEYSNASSSCVNSY